MNKAEKKKMEEYRNWFCDLFDVKEIRYLPEAVLECVLNHKTDVYDKYLEKYPNLDDDSLREFFESYFTDTKLLAQDFTPEGLSQLLNGLAGESDSGEILDECAGIGSLIIPAWSKNHDITVYARELSITTLPFLLFNLALRNIQGVVVRGDTLSLDSQEIYILKHGSNYSFVQNFEWVGEHIDPLKIIRILMLDEQVTRIANEVAK